MSTWKRCKSKLGPIRCELGVGHVNAPLGSYSHWAFIKTSSPSGFYRIAWWSQQANPPGGMTTQAVVITAEGKE